MRILAAMCLALALAITGCAAPAPGPDASKPAATPGLDAGATGGTEAPATAEATPGAATAPPKVVAPVAAGAVVQIDTSCRSDADCVVKDVGNCCGAFPACVNRNSPTDPEGVRARCAAEDRASVCGFNEITACTCVRNNCVAAQEPVGGWINGAPPPPPADR